MTYIRPEELYRNSLLHFSKTKSIKVEDKYIDVNLTLLDKRFITFHTDPEVLKPVLPYCILKNIDDYWIGIYSSYFLNYTVLFNKLLEAQLIVDVDIFLEIVERGA